MPLPSSTSPLFVISTWDDFIKMNFTMCEVNILPRGPQVSIISQVCEVKEVAWLIFSLV